jgi:hypothetical protein
MDKPLLFDLVNSLYNGAYKVMPEFMKERPMFSAFSMAALGAYGLTKSIQFVSEKYINKIIPNFDSKYLPRIEKAVQYGLPALALLYSVIDPDGAKEILMNHPVYASGMAGAFVGGFIAAQKDLDKRPSLMSLDDKL